MWKIVYIASSLKTAQNLTDYLSQESIMFRTRALGALGSQSPAHIEILVPESEAEDALEILNNQLGLSYCQRGAPVG